MFSDYMFLYHLPQNTSFIKSKIIANTFRLISDFRTHLVVLLVLMETGGEGGGRIISRSSDIRN